MNADINNVKIDTLRNGFDELTDKHLQDIDVFIGADICFWHPMCNSLKMLLFRAVHIGIQLSKN